MAYRRVKDVDAAPLILNSIAAQPGKGLAIMIELRDDAEAITVQAVAKESRVQLASAVPLDVLDAVGLQVGRSGETQRAGGEARGRKVRNVFDG